MTYIEYDVYTSAAVSISSDTIDRKIAKEALGECVSSANIVAKLAKMYTTHEKTEITEKIDDMMKTTHGIKSKIVIK